MRERTVIAALFRAAGIPTDIEALELADALIESERQNSASQLATKRAQAAKVAKK